MIHAVDDVAQVMSDYMAGELEKARVAARPYMTSRGWRVEPDADSPWLYHYYIVQEVMQDFTFLAHDPKFRQVTLEISFAFREILETLQTSLTYGKSSVDAPNDNAKRLTTPYMFATATEHSVFRCLTQMSGQRKITDDHTVQISYENFWNASIAILLWMEKHGLLQTVLQHYVNTALNYDSLEYDLLNQQDITEAIYMVFRRDVVQAFHDVLHNGLDPDLPWEWQQTLVAGKVIERLGNNTAMQKDFEYILGKDQTLTQFLSDQSTTSS